MNTKYKKALYESIMKSVAKTVKQTIDEAFDFNKMKQSMQSDLTNALKMSLNASEKYYESSIDELRNLKPYFTLVKGYGYYLGLEEKDGECDLYFEIPPLYIEQNGNDYTTKGGMYYENPKNYFWYFDDTKLDRFSNYKNLCNTMREMLKMTNLRRRHYQDMLDTIKTTTDGNISYFVPTIEEYAKLSMPLDLYNNENLMDALTSEYDTVTTLVNINSARLYANYMCNQIDKEYEDDKNINYSECTKLNNRQLTQRSFISMMKSLDEDIETYDTYVTIPIFAKIHFSKNDVSTLSNTINNIMDQKILL